MAKAFPLLTISPTGTVGDNISLMLHIRLGEMLHFARFIDDPARIDELHAMRIAAKRLRYTIELFVSYLDGTNGSEITDLLLKTKKIQEMIGEIHDRDVRVPKIIEFLEKHERNRPEIVVGLRTLAEREATERTAYYRKLVKFWGEQGDLYTKRMANLIGSLAGEASVHQP